MSEETIIQGRGIGQEEIGLIRRLLAEHPDWNRTRLSRELCRRWDWRNGAGRFKDMACRTLLLKLERRGWIELPMRQGPSPNAARNRVAPRVEHARDPLRGSLAELLPLRIGVLGAEAEELALFKSLLGQYHYLGLRNPVGENLKYLVRAVDGRVLCCLLFGAAAWRCGPRDRYIGWDETARPRNLSWVANNSRFLVVPWVEVKNLASHVLGRIARRIAGDWEGKYGHGLWALESFVDSSRFRGVCYQAANWRKVGRTTGRTRNDLFNRGPLSSIKDVYLYGLGSDFRRALCTEPAAVPMGR